MPKLSVQITMNRLPAIAKRVPEAADLIVNGTRGPEMVEVAKRHSRVDTGEMRDGWEWHPTGVGEGVLENAVEHTVFNEFGTRNLLPAPMARPAIDEVGPKIVNDFKSLEKYLT